MHFHMGEVSTLQALKCVDLETQYLCVQKKTTDLEF